MPTIVIVQYNIIIVTHDNLVHEDLYGLDTRSVVEFVASLFLGARRDLAACQAIFQVRLELNLGLFNCQCVCTQRRRAAVHVLISSHDYEDETNAIDL